MGLAQTRRLSPGQVLFLFPLPLFIGRLNGFGVRCGLWLCFGGAETVDGLTQLELLEKEFVAGDVGLAVEFAVVQLEN